VTLGPKRFLGANGWKRDLASDRPLQRSYPLLCDLAGISLSGDGRYFMVLLRGEDPAWRSAVLLEAAGGGVPPSYAGVRTETHKYVEYQIGEKELYDLRSDPYESESLHESAGSSLVQRLKAKLNALSYCTGEGCREAEDSP
jgi:N-acetylglucosamine-6-sulfatase